MECSKCKQSPGPAIEQLLTASRVSPQRRRSSIVNQFYRSTKKRSTRHMQAAISEAESKAGTLN